MAVGKKTTWPADKTKKVTTFLKDKMAYKYMSSDEEGDDGFVSHPFSWESEEWKKIKASLD